MAGRRGIEAGRAFVRFGVDMTDFERGLRSARQRLNAFGQAVTGIGAAITGIGLAGLTPFIAGLRSLTTAGDTIDKASQRAGVAADEFQRLRFALEQTGASGDTAERAFRGLSRFVRQVEEGSSSATEALSRLGLDRNALGGGVLETLTTILESVRELSDDPIVRGGLLQQIFGRAGTELLPLLNAGPGGLQSLLQQFEDLNLGVDDGVVREAAAFTDAVNVFRTSVRSLSLTVGAAVSGPLGDLAVTFSRLVGGIKEFVSNNGELVATFAAIAGAVTVIGVATTAIGGVALGLGVIVGFLPAIAGFVIAGGKILAIVAGIGAAIVGLSAGLVTLERNTRAVSVAFSTLAATIATVFSGLAGGLSNSLNALIVGNFRAVGEQAGLAFASGLIRAYERLGIDGLFKLIGINDPGLLATVAEAAIEASAGALENQAEEAIQRIRESLGGVGGIRGRRGVTVGTFSDDPRLGSIGSVSDIGRTTASINRNAERAARAAEVVADVASDFRFGSGTGLAFG